MKGQIAAISLDHFHDFVRVNCSGLVLRVTTDSTQIEFPKHPAIYGLFVTDETYDLRALYNYPVPAKHSHWLPARLRVSVADPTSLEQIEQKLLELNDLIL